MAERQPPSDPDPLRPQDSGSREHPTPEREEDQEAIELPDREAMSLLRGPGEPGPIALDPEQYDTLPVEPRDGT